jgi:hypothetical protein
MRPMVRANYTAKSGFLPKKPKHTTPPLVISTSGEWPTILRFGIGVPSTVSYQTQPPFHRLQHSVLHEPVIKSAQIF